MTGKPKAFHMWLLACGVVLGVLALYAAGYVQLRKNYEKPRNSLARLFIQEAIRAGEIIDEDQFSTAIRFNPDSRADQFAYYMFYPAGSLDHFLTDCNYTIERINVNRCGNFTP